MNKFLESQKTYISKFDNGSKILLIVEGKTELFFITKIYALLKNEFIKDSFKKLKTLQLRLCQNYIDEVFTLSWGKNFNNCENFQGGGKNAPYPAIESFEIYKNRLDTFNFIIVMFDGDKDKKKEVSNYFIETFRNLKINHYLLISNPCFEKSLIQFFSKEDKLFDSDFCEDKNLFSSLDSFKNFNSEFCRNKQVDANGLIRCIDLENIKNLDITTKIERIILDSNN